MHEVIENISKLGFGGLFGAAVSHVLLLFTTFHYADGSVVSVESVILTGAFIGASFSRIVERLFFSNFSRYRRRRAILVEVLNQDLLPTEKKSEIIQEIYKKEIVDYLGN